MKKDCIFCKIINGEVPCYKIAENEQAVAFLDIASDCYGHTLVIPKKHFDNVADCDGIYITGVSKLINQVSNHYIKNCGFDGVNVFNASGECAGQTVFHLHFHIIPRKKEDNVKLNFSFPGESTPLEEVCKHLSLVKKTGILRTGESVVLYTDGACSNNPGIGGYCSILQYDNKEKIISGGEELTTNNRMELMGVLKGLQAIKNGATVQVYSDSAYVVNAFEQNWIVSWQKNGWKSSSGSQVLNMDLWKELVEQTKRLNVIWNKVKGHADNELNNRCDEIAREEVRKIKERLE